ncbi:unnamed protein product, partial [Scytosiphon promiscuus]
GPKAPPVVERIRTQDGYEKAIAAALGDDIEAPTDRSAAMYWGGASLASQSLPQGTRPLTDVTEAPGELAARLAQCGVVDVADGESLMAQLQPGQRLGSVEGHLWRWEGYSRTPDAPVSAAARLEQQARLEAAEAELPALTATYEACEADLVAARDARQTAEVKLRDLRQAIAPAQRALSEARNRVSQEAQASGRAAMKRATSGEGLTRAEGDVAIVN